MTTADYNMFVKEFWRGRRMQDGSPDLTSFMIMSLGLAGETGEVMELIKKDVRDGVDPTDKIKLELGDVLYYLTCLAWMYGHTLEDVMQANVDKLKHRREHGKKEQN